MQQQTKQRVTLIHVLAERWDMQKKGITQHLRHPSFFTSWEEFVLRQDPVCHKQTWSSCWMGSLFLESGGVVDDHGFHLCVLTDLSAMLGPCHQMP